MVDHGQCQQLMTGCDIVKRGTLYVKHLPSLLPAAFNIQVRAATRQKYTPSALLNIGAVSHIQIDCMVEKGFPVTKKNQRSNITCLLYCSANTLNILSCAVGGSRCAVGRSRNNRPMVFTSTRAQFIIKIRSASDIVKCSVIVSAALNSAISGLCIIAVRLSISVINAVNGRVCAR